MDHDQLNSRPFWQTGTLWSKFVSAFVSTADPGGIKVGNKSYLTYGFLPPAGGKRVPNVSTPYSI